ncbi:MAG: helix-turn-helix domain-containing protein [Christensenellales bacterium]|jgi:transcriptional regulator with XRE-family HTH domain
MKTEIRNHRIARGLAKTDLAKALGYESGLIITMRKSGDRRPPSDKLPALARILDCSINDLFAVDQITKTI